MEGHREMKPLGIGEVVDLAVNIYIRNWKKLATVAACVIVPITLISIVLDFVAYQEVSPFSSNATLYIFDNGQTRILDKTTYDLISGLESVLLVIGYLIIIGATLRAVGDAYLGREVDTRGALRFGLRRMHSVLWVAIIYYVVVIIGFILVVIPGIWLSVALAFAIPVLIFEGTKGRKAIDRSFNLVQDNWWRSLAALLVGFVFIGLLLFAIPLAIRAIVDNVDNIYIFGAALDIGQGVTAILSAPFEAALLTVIYYDLRVRKEGYDVQLLTQDLDGFGAAPAPAPPLQPQTEPQAPPAPLV